jgi:FkbM family methyltransferase
MLFLPACLCLGGDISGLDKIRDLENKFSFLLKNDYLNDFPYYLYEKVSDKNNTIFLVDTCKRLDVIKSAIINRCWEGSLHDVICKYIRPNSIVLDIGRHIGTHAINFAKYVGRSGYVIAFEPNPKIYRELHYNLKINNIHNLLALPIAIGDVVRIGHVIPQHPLNEGNTLFLADNQGDVRVFPSDNFDLTNISFIKIDVEGYEKRVLLGAAQTIMRERPIICLEMWSTNVDEVTNLLYDFNYDVKRIENDDFLAIPLGVVA